MTSPAILGDLRIVEGSAFVAAPLCGMTLAQLGADVIRFDQIGGGLDYGRWPLSGDGQSLYWAGLNKGKRSIALDLRAAEGRELAQALVVAPGPGSGLFLTNFPDAGWLAYDRLREMRSDLIYLNITGNPDGSSAVDYTINCATGLPYVTGSGGRQQPTNHVLPAWDLTTGLTAALGLLAAERRRRLTGEGGRVRLPLADVAFAALGALGHIAETQLVEDERQPTGNYLYGAFGRDFESRDGERFMVVAITPRQWSSLVESVGLADVVSHIEAETGYDLKREGDRFRAREPLAAAVQQWCSERFFSDIAARFDAAGVCWGRYQSFKQLLDEDPRCSQENPMFGWVEQPGIGRYLAPGSPLDFGEARQPELAPTIGQHTDEILGDILGLPAHAIGALHDRGIVA